LFYSRVLRPACAKSRAEIRLDSIRGQRQLSRWLFLINLSSSGGEGRITQANTQSPDRINFVLAQQRFLQNPPVVRVFFNKLKAPNQGTSFGPLVCGANNREREKELGGLPRLRCTQHAYAHIKAKRSGDAERFGKWGFRCLPTSLQHNTPTRTISQAQWGKRILPTAMQRNTPRSNNESTT